jgi:hypothetical protein
MGFTDIFQPRKVSRMLDFVVASALCTPLIIRINCNQKMKGKRSWLTRVPQKSDQDRKHKRTELKYEGGNGGHRVTFVRDLDYHPSGTPAQSQKDLQLPRSGDVRGRDGEGDMGGKEEMMEEEIQSRSRHGGEDGVRGRRHRLRSRPVRKLGRGRGTRALAAISFLLSISLLQEWG